MNNFSHKKLWRTGAVKIHIEPTLIMLLKCDSDTKSERCCVKFKLRRDPIPE